MAAWASHQASDRGTSARPTRLVHACSRRVVHRTVPHQATKEARVEELKAALKQEREVKLAHLKQELDEKLRKEVTELEQLVTIEGGRRLEEELASVRASYEKQRRDAERSMMEANRQAAAAMRGQLEKEHKVRT